MGKRIGPDGVCLYHGVWWKLALPWVILPVHLALAAAVAALACARAEVPWRVVPAGVGAGWVLWTLFEYALHRWVLHHTRTPLLRRLFWQALHREHHAYRTMHDPDHHGVHVAVSVPSVALVAGVVHAAGGGGFALAVTAGWLLGYCGYEALHWLFHSTEADSSAVAWRPLRSLWDAHTHHHLRRADTNYGFVTQFWDRRFGTAGDAPRKLGNSAAVSPDQ